MKQNQRKIINEREDDSSGGSEDDDIKKKFSTLKIPIGIND